MTWLYILIGMCIGSIIILFIRNIQYAKRINNLEFTRRCHATTITELKREIEQLKKEEIKDLEALQKRYESDIYVDFYNPFTRKTTRYYSDNKQEVI